MSHDHTLEERYGQATWDERYGGTERVWSGKPNRRLVEQITGITPGDALDVGAGEGADAVWLAQQGWRVTALDVSPVALEHTRRHVEEAGLSVTTVRHDLIHDGVVPGSYDLVSAHFWHPPADRRDEFDTHIGAAVRPGGLLLLVGHHPDDLVHAGKDPHGHADFLFTPENLVAVLPADRWDIRLAEAQTRPGNRPDGPATMTDTVVLAERRR